MRTIPHTDLHVFPLCLGGNVFGWTVDESASRVILDAFVSAGGNWVDTANSYSAWVPENPPGISESIIGRWMKARGNRDRMIVTTKVGELEGLAPERIRRSTHESLGRLQTDRIDLLYAHKDDPATPLESTLQAFGELVRDGVVRYIGASNYSAPRLAEALAAADAEDLPRFAILQPRFNLVEREHFESELQQLCVREGIPTAPYFALANGFLTGKYRARRSPAGARAQDAMAHDGGRGRRVLDALDAVAARHGTGPAAVALGWLARQATVVAPIASARTPAQLKELLAVADLALSDGDLRALDDASASAVEQN